MLSKLLQPKVKAFIKKHENGDLNKLLFSKNKFPEIPIDLVVDQIKARHKAKQKLPLWFNTEGIIMPSVLSMEQSSSEQTALYKSKLFKGELAIDLTGGAGVDAYFLSRQFKNVIYIELNEVLAEIAAHNFKMLGVSNIEVINTNSEAFIEKFNKHADLFYIDPARRDQHQRLFLLEDCSPNIVSLQNRLFKKAETIMVKASPMLDIAKALTQLTQVCEVQIMAIKNEVKELLFIQSNTEEENPKITAKDLATDYVFTTHWNQSNYSPISQVLNYLYEPNVAILKSNKVNRLSELFDLKKLNPNTHLFTSENIIEEFPGRIFKVINVLKYDKKELKKELPNLKANISIRNFPDTVDEIRRKTGIKSGGNVYLFGIRDFENKLKVLLCSKI